MKKKILAFICLITILFSNINIYAKYPDMPENTNEARIVDIITDLGVMEGYEDGTFKPEQAVTRAEFVTVLHNAVKYWGNISSEGDIYEESSDGFNWSAFFLGDGSSELELMYPPSEDSETEVVKKGLWNDVDEEYWAYTNLRDVAMTGSIKGYEDGSFRPDNTVTYNEAIKIILSICGYSVYAEQYGGYPEGYINIANENKLYNGISATGNQPLSRMDVATLIYNSFTVELAPTPYDDNKDGKNFLNDIMGIYMLEGTLNSTDITSIYSDEANRANVAKIGDFEFSFSDDSDIREYIGRDIRTYLKKISDIEYTMQAFEATGRDVITDIEIRNFERYENNKFYYFKTSDATKETSINISEGSVIIYNGKYLASYDSSTFDNLNQGTISVIKKRDLDFDIIVIENFESGYVENVNAKNMEIVDSVKAGGSGGALIKLKSDDQSEILIYQLINAEGEQITIDELGTGAINYYQNDNYVKLYYTDNKISGNISGYYVEDEKTWIEIGEQEYALSKQYALNIGSNVRSGMNVTVSLDMFGEIVWISDNVSVDGYAYLIKVTRNDDDQCLNITYFDIDTNQIKKSVTSQSIRLTDKYNKTTKYAYESLYDELETYDGIVKISTDENEAINKIALALDSNVEQADKLKMVMESNNDSNSTNYYKNINYMGSAFSGKYFLDANSIIISVPTDRENYDYYKTISFNTLTNGNYLFKLYTFDPQSPYAKIAVIYQQGSSTDLFNRVPYYFVMDVMNGLNSDDEQITELTLFNPETGETTQTSAVCDGNGYSVFEKAYDAFMQENTYTISKGDIIQIAIDATQDIPVAVRILYDADGINPAWCCNDPVNKPTSCPEGHEHTTNILGCVPGSSGFVSHDKNFTNPFGYTNGNVSNYPKVPGSSNVWQMFVLGYIHSTKEGLLRITTQNLQEGFTGEEDDNYYWVYDNPAKVTVSVYFINETKNGYVIETASINDIHTYAMAGSDCDQVFIYNPGGIIRQILVFRK